MDLRCEPAAGRPDYNAAGGVVEAELSAGERLHVLYPRQIAAYRGAPSNREDRFTEWSALLRRKKWIQTRLTGPCSCLIALPAGYTATLLPLEQGGDLLFDYNSLLFHSDGIELRHVLQTVKNWAVTRDWFRVKLSGEGQIGLLTRGPLHPWRLDPEIPSFIEAGSLVAYPENAVLQWGVYGNHLAAQRMRYQWKITGHGHALIQHSPHGYGSEGPDREDGWIKRLLQETLPFGNVWIK